MSEVRVTNLTKKFGQFVAVDDINFAFPESKVTCLLGPSGCGKTTLLRMISGLESPSRGKVFFGDRDVTGLPPRKLNIGMVFQYPVVYRGISVRKNIELPLMKGKFTASERKQRVDKVLELMDLEKYADQESTQLDNVARQKVSVARAVAYQPDVILFDEPMTNIDANSKIQFKHAFKALTRQLNQVIVYVTHDQTEAMTLADQIALMENGKIVQCQAPRTLYNEPEDVFGGWFLGNPGMNFVKAQVEKRGTRNIIASKLFTAPLMLNAEEIDSEVTIGIRPEHITLNEMPSEHSVEATVKSKTLTIGGQYLFTLEIGEQTLKAKVDNSFGSAHSGKRAWVELPLEHIVVFNSSERRVHGKLSL